MSLSDRLEEARRKQSLNDIQARAADVARGQIEQSSSTGLVRRFVGAAAIAGVLGVGAMELRGLFAENGQPPQQIQIEQNNGDPGQQLKEDLLRLNPKE